MCKLPLKVTFQGVELGEFLAQTKIIFRALPVQKRFHATGANYNYNTGA